LIPLKQLKAIALFVKMGFHKIMKENVWKIVFKGKIETNLIIVVVIEDIMKKMENVKNVSSIVLIV
jgi:hypothetical protein